MEIDLKNAKCTELSIETPVITLAKEEGKRGEFVIEAYTGAVVERWWGKLAIDIDGISAPSKMPNFFNHDHGQIVGFSTKSWKDGSFFVAGKFSKSTEAAKEVQGLADEEFPWQASIGVRAKKVMQLEEGVSHVVNGAQLDGPAEIWTESEVFEVSFVPFGADGNTKVSTFSKFAEASPQGEIPKPAEKGDIHMPITIASLTAEAPALLAEIQTAAKAEGANAERERIKGVLAQSLPGHEAIVQKLAFDGSTNPDQAAVAVLAAERAMRASAVQDLHADAVPPVPAPAAPPAPKAPEQPTTKEAFEADKALVAEFGDWDTYNAYLAATERGLVRILKNKER
jgi:hypothetical protein